ncbi:hypothetical protein GGR56DRAFT_678556 [Xylariaceae sp. FL0804]|nr:hypothetical protein GGR56DRAFT_678556 [Xylariaceae sp. FL0804]
MGFLSKLGLCVRVWFCCSDYFPDDTSNVTSSHHELENVQGETYSEARAPSSKGHTVNVQAPARSVGTQSLADCSFGAMSSPSSIFGPFSPPIANSINTKPTELIYTAAASTDVRTATTTPTPTVTVRPIRTTPDPPTPAPAPTSTMPSAVRSVVDLPRFTHAHAPTPPGGSRKKPPTRELIDAHGDLCLEVGDVYTKCFVVCSRTVARASPFFKQLLYGGFAESKTKTAARRQSLLAPSVVGGFGGGGGDDGRSSICSRRSSSRRRRNRRRRRSSRYDDDYDYDDDDDAGDDDDNDDDDDGDEEDWVVRLPDDNADAMGTLVRIMHGSFDAVPGYEDDVYALTLYQMCVLTDKYDMTHLLRPWAAGWARSVNARSRRLGLSLLNKACHQRLWIAWELGDAATFEQTATELLLESSDADKLNPLRFGCLEPEDIYEHPTPELPNGPKDIIEKTRVHVIRELLRPFEELVSDLIQKKESHCREGGRGGAGTCLAAMLGTAIQGLFAAGLWPLPADPATVRLSVAALADRLRAVHVEGSSSGGHRGPHRCTYGGTMRERVDRVLAAVPPLLTQAHRRHLDAHARKSGLYSAAGQAAELPARRYSMPVENAMFDI